MIIHSNFQQRSDEWYKIRLGIPTASAFHNVITPLGVPTRGDRRKKYLYRLIAERLLQQSMDDRFENQWTRRGKELEDEAMMAFARHCKLNSDQLASVGFITTDDGKIGCSPDFLIRGKGKNAKVREAAEIKSPSPWVMVEYLLEGIGENWRPQVQGQIMIAELEQHHLWAYHPNMPPVHIVTKRDDKFIEKLAKELYFFCNELDIETERARRLGPYTLAKVLKLSAELRDDVPGTFPWH